MSGKTYHDFRKISCPHCRVVFVLALEDASRLPEEVVCSRCFQKVDLPKNRPRRFSRKRVEKAVTFATSDSRIVKGRILDFSPGGLRLVSAERMGPHEEVIVSLAGKRVRARVVWMKREDLLEARFPGGYVLGLEFLEPLFEKGIILNTLS